MHDDPAVKNKVVKGELYPNKMFPKKCSGLHRGKQVSNPRFYKMDM